MKKLLRRIKCRFRGHDWRPPVLSFWPDVHGKKALLETCRRCGTKRRTG